MSDGSRPRAGSDEERLPWLEPYREPGAARARRKAAAPATPAAPPARPSARRGRTPLLALVGAATLGAALAGGYWIGIRQAEPIAPAARPVAPPPVAEATRPPTAPLAEAEQAGPVAVVERSRPATSAPPRRRVAARHVVRVAAARPRPHAVAAAVQVHYGPRAPRYWPYGRMPSPGPAGQVIQLGAFRTPQRAHAAYWRRAGRYPLLTHMPRAVLPVMTRPSGQLLYVLRLGTASRQQSHQVCRNLRASGDHCLVIG